MWLPSSAVEVLPTSPWHALTINNQLIHLLEATTLSSGSTMLKRLRGRASLSLRILPLITRIHPAKWPLTALAVLCLIWKWTTTVSSKWNPLQCKQSPSYPPKKPRSKLAELEGVETLPTRATRLCLVPQLRINQGRCEEGEAQDLEGSTQLPSSKQPPCFPHPDKKVAGDEAKALEMVAWTS